MFLKWHSIGHQKRMEKLLEQLLAKNPEFETPLSKEEIADILQNDISQTLAAVLLWLQSAMEDKELHANKHLQLAESNLKDSVKKLVRLHYAILEA